MASATSITEKQAVNLINNNDNNNNEIGHTAFFWGNAFHLVPEDFRFPAMTCRLAFGYWCVGSESHNFPPFPLLHPVDMKTTPLKKRLCNLKTIMNRLENHLKAVNIWIVGPNESQINHNCSLAFKDSSGQITTEKSLDELFHKKCKACIKPSSQFD
eukprot:NODE_701_length_5037_cov_0.452318.p4 type:complete len:157 gc:universal NODE_701_length_5037_cov_0.452318:1441-1911(+)